MRNSFQAVALCSLLAASAISIATPANAAPPERYLHVRVDDSTKGENVNVNVPLSLAEAVLPTVNKGPLHDGRVTVPHAKANGIDIHAIMDAVRNAPDGEFVTVKQKDEDVRVSKSNGNILVHVRDGKKADQNVDATVPMNVVNALISGTSTDQLDLAAGIRALSDASNTFLVTVQDATEHVRVWVDSSNTQN